MPEADVNAKKLLRRAHAAVRTVELRVLVVVLLVGLAGWAVAEIADSVRDGATTDVDESILIALRDYRDPAVGAGPGWLPTAMLSTTALGDTTILLLLIVVVTGFLLLRRLRGMALVVLLASLGGVALSTTLKDLFGRDRPSVVPHLVHVSNESFPSGHSLQSAVVYLTLGALLAQAIHERSVRLYVLLVSIGITLGVGFSRVYLGVHYPTDVLAGWAAGAAWAMVCWLVLWAMHRERVVATHEEELPATSA